MVCYRENAVVWALADVSNVLVFSGYAVTGIYFQGFFKKGRSNETVSQIQSVGHRDWHNVFGILRLLPVPGY